MKRWILGIVGLLAVVTATLLIVAPQLPALVLEGFPSLLWSGRGSYATVGTDRPSPIAIAPEAATASLDPRLNSLFEEKGGKAMLIYLEGQVVLEHYAPGVDAGTRLNSYSMAKGIIGALVFRAIADEKIGGLDATLGELLPEAAGLAEVSLESLLTMRSGIDFDGGKFGEASGKTTEMAPSPFSPLAKLHFLGLAPVVAGLKVRAEETHEFNYQNVNTALLGAVLERAYGEPLETLLTTKLWEPSGAGTTLWRRTSAASPVSAYCCLYATARDWIAIGTYLMHNGTPEAPFLPDPLWRTYLGLDVPRAERAIDHYGMQVRQNILDRPGEELQGPFTYLFGQGGQVLYLLPDRDLVVFRAGEHEQLLHSTLYWAWDSVDN